MLKKLIFTLASLIVAVITYGAWYFSPILNAGSGFSAKNICSGFFLSGMPGQEILEEALIPAAPILSNISFDIDTANHKVDTRLFGLFHRRAVYSEGTGCTLLAADQQQLQRDVHVPAINQQDKTLAWPEGSAPVPQWHIDADDPRGVITVDQLLRMSSGLAFDEEYGLYSDVTRMLSVEADAAGFAASKSLLTEPDSLWAYSSGTSNILSGIIRRTVAGNIQNYFDFTQNRLFLALGIHTAALETDNNGTFIGSSFMYASARDWARLGQFCLQDGQWQGKQLLPAGWINYSTTPTPNNPRNNYGAHFWLNADPADGQKQRTWPNLPADTFSMNGFQGQRVVIIPSKEMVVVHLGFSTGSKRYIEELVAGLAAILAPG